MRRCLNGNAPQYGSSLCPSLSTASRQHLRSAASHQVVVTASYRTIMNIGSSLLPVRRRRTRRNVKACSQSHHLCLPTIGITQDIFFLEYRPTVV